MKGEPRPVGLKSDIKRAAQNGSEPVHSFPMRKQTQDLISFENY